MNKIKNLIVSFALVMGFGFMMMPSTTVGALDLFPSCEGSSSDATICKDEGDSASVIIKSIVNLLLFALGAVSVVMIIYAGVIYTTSAGDSSKIKKAKDIILYSVVGIVVASLSFAIVNFVVKAL